MVFCEDGHLRDEALAALARNEDVFEELERLERRLEALEGQKEPA